MQTRRIHRVPGWKKKKKKTMASVSSRSSQRVIGGARRRCSSPLRARRRAIRVALVSPTRCDVCNYNINELLVGTIRVCIVCDISVFDYYLFLRCAHVVRRRADEYDVRTGGEVGVSISAHLSLSVVLTQSSSAGSSFAARRRFFPRFCSRRTSVAFLRRPTLMILLHPACGHFGWCACPLNFLCCLI